jgi:hypothetical protein
MENSLRSVALLNVKGVHALVMGRKNHVPRSVSAFKEALALLDQIPKRHRHHDACRTSCLEAINSSPVSPLEAQLDSSFYVYNRALSFHPLSDTSALGIAFYTAILQFNIALAHHSKLVGTNSAPPPRSKSALTVAVRYYKQCLKTLKQVGVSGDRPPHPGGGEAMIYLRLAALNNLANVQFRAGNLDKVHDTLGRIFKFSVAHRPTLFQTQPIQNSSSQSEDNDNAPRGARRQTANTMNSAFVNEVLLNVMVSGLVSAAAAA